MFDGLLKSKFYSKCKSAIKLTTTRIDMIKRKRNAMQKFLRKDIADLLKNGLDINAFGRSGGLLVELNMSACYDFVEQFCGCISNHLSMMNKQRECPEECREAVPSLTFAAARFADLPELRDLRSIFAARYKNSLEACVNQEFVEKLKAMPPTKDMKLQLLQDIALDSGLQWDSKALEQKLYNPPASEQAWSKNANDDKNKLHKSRDEAVRKVDKQGTENKQYNVRDAAPKRNKDDDDRYKLRGSENNAVCGGDPENIPSKDSRVASNDQKPEENTDDKKPFYNRFVPPPYTKTKAGETKTSLEVPSPGSSGGDGIGTAKFSGRVDGEDNPHRDDSVSDAKPKPRSVRRTRMKPPPGHDNTGSDEGNRVRTQEAAKQGLKIISQDGHDQKDEEERVMDTLLMRYSTKQSTYEMGKVKEALKPPPSQQQSKDGPPDRTTSLPPETRSPIEMSNGPARASSFQPDTGHVHPKLPDYDDFLARLAALRGK